MSQFSQNEMLILDELKISQEDVLNFIKIHGDAAFDVVVGGILNIRKGGGQERNEPFTPQGAPETGSVETNGVKSIPLEEFNALSDEEKKNYAPQA